MLLPSSLRGFQSAGNAPALARPKSSITLQSSAAGTGGAASMTGRATKRASRTPITKWRTPCAGATVRPSAAPAPPVVDEVVDHLAELADRAALAHDVAGRGVHRHHAVADAPAPLALGVEPDDAFHALADEPQRPRLRVVIVVPRVAQDQDRRLAVERLQLRVREAAEGEAEVRAAVVVDGGRLEGPLDTALHRIRVEGLRDLGDLGHEHVRAHAAEALLQAPHELQHEARRVAHGVGDVADRDELGLLAVAALEEDLHGHAAVRETLANRPARVEPPSLLLPLAQREGVLDLARQPRHHVLHLG